MAVLVAVLEQLDEPLLDVGRPSPVPEAEEDERRVDPAAEDDERERYPGHMDLGEARHEDGQERVQEEKRRRRHEDVTVAPSWARINELSSVRA